MTEGMMNLRSLMAKTKDADLLHETIAFAAERLIGDRGRGAYACSPWREERGLAGSAQWLSRPGLRDAGRTVEPGIQKLRRGSFFPGFLEPRRIAENEKEMTAVIASSVFPEIPVLIG